MKTITYNQTGDTRKPFVKAIGGLLGVKPRYLGTPTYAYEIGAVTVTRGGNIEVGDQIADASIENLIEQLAAKGYVPVQTTEEPEAPAEEPEADEPSSMTISVPRKIMTDAGVENLKKLITAKAALLKQSFGIETTEITVSDEAVSFPWFGILEPDELRLASLFISGLCRFANGSKRIICKPREEDNPKFAMRVWLIRMGFGGDDHRALRKYMLRNLPGNSAFRYGRPDAKKEENA